MKSTLPLALAMSAAVLASGVSGAAAQTTSTEVEPNAQVAADIKSPTGDFRVPFKCRQVWTANKWRGHTPSNSAIDFQRSPAQGVAVYSSASGTVETVKNLGNRSYGKYIVIRHSGGYKTLYAHLSSQNVKPGQKVTSKTFIGRVGSTGNVSGPHLHYEQRRNGKVVVAKFVDGSPKPGIGRTNVSRKGSCP